jgi:hypothetical protein
MLRDDEHDLLRPEGQDGLDGTLIAHLWRGQVEDAIAQLEAYRSQCRNEEKLGELINYLTARKPYLISYKDRRTRRIYIGSGHAEKACDLIVSRRQRHKGMH